ncbi:MAG TPA: 2-phosphosulfolactate phosphatase [Actinomycetes bacterium]|nr:2-phosphosulfolactate phosphatase [Actinomycetes bacterium]
MRVAVEWGPAGAKVLSESCDVLVVVDVLSFSTALTVAVERGAKVWPHTGGESAGQLARDIDAVLAGNRSSHEGVTLSPASLRDLPDDARLVLPSPNGSSIAFAAVNGALPVVAGCLRNAHAVARHLRDVERIGIVPAGERWGDGSLRPAYEDLVGAGAVVERLTAEEPGVELSPEAEAAAAAFRWLRPLAQCPSGIELIDKGYADDVTIAEQVDASDVVPVMVEGRFVAV